MTAICTDLERNGVIGSVNRGSNSGGTLYVCAAFRPIGAIRGCVKFGEHVGWLVFIQPEPLVCDEGWNDMGVLMRTVAGMVALAGAGLLAGCGHEIGVTARSTLPVYSVDVQGGAKLCTVPAVSLEAGKTAAASITVGNDGGWCGLLIHQDGPKPYDAGLLTTRPTHGTVTIHSVGDNTRIDYVPDARYTGPDSYVVSLLPGSPVLRVTVTVVPPGTPPAKS